MSQFLIVLRDAGAFPPDLSPSEYQAIARKYRAWIEGMKGAGQKLRDGEGRVVVRKDSGLSVTDGPYAESREIIGGYLVVEAESYDDVVRHCDASPHLDYGSIEIRQIDVMPRS